MLIFVSLSRLSFRIVDEGIKKGRRKGKPTLIYGAGVGGQMLAKEIENNESLGMVLVGFIDDNPRKYKRKISGYPVLGSKNDLEKIIRKNNIEEIVLSFRENNAQRKKEIQDICSRLGGEIEVNQMRLVIS